MSRTCVIVGSSPSVARYIKRVFDEHPHAVVLTSNGGYAICIAHERKVDYYMCSDTHARRKFALYRENHEGNLIESDGSMRFSFQYMLATACSLGPDVIEMVGCDWYPDEEPGYFDGREVGEGMRESLKNDELSDWYWALCARYPKIQFAFHPEPAWLHEHMNSAT